MAKPPPPIKRPTSACKKESGKRSLGEMEISLLPPGSVFAGCQDDDSACRSEIPSFPPPHSTPRAAAYNKGVMGRFLQTEKAGEEDKRRLCCVWMWLYFPLLASPTPLLSLFPLLLLRASSSSQTRGERERGGNLTLLLLLLLLRPRPRAVIKSRKPPFFFGPQVIRRERGETSLSPRTRAQEIQ